MNITCEYSTNLPEGSAAPGVIALARLRQNEDRLSSPSTPAATILHLLGLNHERMTDVEGRVTQEIIA